MKTDFNIDDFLRNSADAFEMQPRISSFDAVLKKLEKKKRRRFFILLFFSLGIGLFTTAALFWPTSGSKAVARLSLTTSSNVNPNKNDHLKNNSLSSKALAASHHNLNKKHNSRQPAVNPPHDRHVALVPAPAKNITVMEHEPASTHNETISPQAVTNKTSSPDLLITAGPVIPDSALVHDDVAMVIDSVGKIPPPRDTMAAGPATTVTDSLAPRKKRSPWMLGIHANPQYSSLLLRGNEKRDPVYDQTGGINFPQEYLKKRKEQNAFDFSYALGLKLGYQLNESWEIWLSAGMQRTFYYEKLYVYSTTQGLTSTGINGVLYSNAAAPPPREGFRNQFTYGTMGLNVTRMFMPNPFLKLKCDVGLKFNHLVSSRATLAAFPNIYYYDYGKGTPGLARWTYTSYLNFGMIRDFTKRLQGRISPGLFFMPSSMFSKNYVIRQNSFGAELECLLLYKF